VHRSLPPTAPVSARHLASFVEGKHRVEITAHLPAMDGPRCQGAEGNRPTVAVAGVSIASVNWISWRAPGSVRARSQRQLVSTGFSA
jgi:hypothetical protein